MSRDVLPTISELVKRLNAVITEHGDLPVLILDADTEWLLDVEGVKIEDGKALLWGEYGNL